MAQTVESLLVQLGVDPASVQSLIQDTNQAVQQAQSGAQVNVPVQATGIQRLTAQFRSFSAQSAQQINRVRQSVAGLAQSIRRATQGLMAVSAIGGVAGAIAGREGVTASTSLAAANVILSQSFSELAITQEQVSAISREFGGSITQVTDALFPIASAGFRGAQAMDILRESVRSAQFGLTDASTVFGAIGPLVANFGLEAADAADVLQVLNEQAVGTAGELADALGFLAPTASSLGLSIEELAASFGAITQQTFDATRATTQLQQLILRIVQPAEQFKDAFERIGIATGDGAFRVQSLSDVLGILRTRLQEGDVELVNLFRSSVALQALRPLIDNFDNFNDSLAAFETRTGAAAAASNRFTREAGPQLTRLFTDLRNTFAEAARTLLQEFQPAIERISNFISENQSLISSIARTTLIVGGLAAGIGTLSFVLGAIAPVVGVVASAFGTIVTIGKALAVTVGTLLTSIPGLLVLLGSGVGVSVFAAAASDAGGLLGVLRELRTAAGTVFQGFLNAGREFIRPVAEEMSSLAATIREDLAEASRGASLSFASLAEGISNAMSRIAQIAGNVSASIIRFFGPVLSQAVVTASSVFGEFLLSLRELGVIARELGAFLGDMFTIVVSGSLDARNGLETMRDAAVDSLGFIQRVLTSATFIRAWAMLQMAIAGIVNGFVLLAQVARGTLGGVLVLVSGVVRLFGTLVRILGLVSSGIDDFGKSVIEAADTILDEGISQIDAALEASGQAINRTADLYTDAINRFRNADEIAARHRADALAERALREAVRSTQDLVSQTEEYVSTLEETAEAAAKSGELTRDQVESVRALTQARREDLALVQRLLDAGQVQEAFALADTLAFDTEAQIAQLGTLTDLNREILNIQSQRLQAWRDERKEIQSNLERAEAGFRRLRQTIEEDVEAANDFIKILSDSLLSETERQVQQIGDSFVEAAQQASQLDFLGEEFVPSQEIREGFDRAINDVLRDANKLVDDLNKRLEDLGSGEDIDKALQQQIEAIEADRSISDDVRRARIESARQLAAAQKAELEAEAEPIRAELDAAQAEVDGANALVGRLRSNLEQEIALREQEIASRRELVESQGNLIEQQRAQLAGLGDAPAVGLEAATPQDILTASVNLGDAFLDSLQEGLEKAGQEAQEKAAEAGRLGVEGFLGTIGELQDAGVRIAQAIREGANPLEEISRTIQRDFNDSFTRSINAVSSALPTLQSGAAALSQSTESLSSGLVNLQDATSQLDAIASAQQQNTSRLRSTLTQTTGAVERLGRSILDQNNVLQEAEDQISQVAVEAESPRRTQESLRSQGYNYE